MTDCHHHDVLARLSFEHRALRQLIPDVYRGFAAMSDAALVDGALSAKVKELMAMAIGLCTGATGVSRRTRKLQFARARRRRKPQRQSE